MSQTEKTSASKQINGKKKTTKKFQIKMELSARNIITWVLVGLFVLSFLYNIGQGVNYKEEIPLSKVLSDIRSQKISKITVEDSKLTVKYKNGTEFVSHKETGESLIKIFEAQKVDTKNIELLIKDNSGSGLLLSIIGNVLPIVLMVIFFLFLIRQARGAQDSIFSFGNSRAKLFNKEMTKVRFSDVAGVDEAKRELEEVVDFLKNPQKYRLLGARTPKGVLLVGPAGTGKTLLARAVAGEAGVTFFSMAGSEFMEMLVGVGASRVRDLFATAKKSAPAIIFIDEIDAIGRMRAVGIMGGHDEREQTLNQILVEMDGFLPNDHVIVLAATNRGDLLDPALLRPGRFDRRVMLDMPDLEGRKAILLIHMKGKPFTTDVDWEKVAKRTVGFSGADLENMLNESAILAARGNKTAIDMKDIEEAATKVKLGPEKKRLQSDLDKKMTAYHEAGHAIVSYSIPAMDPVHRISIVSRGMSLGHTLIPPAQDRTHETKSRLLGTIAIMLGGRAAEEIVFKDISTGASDDISKATRIAREMVVDFGMSILGPVNLGPNIMADDMGRAYYEQTQISNEMAAKVDMEINKILEEAYQNAIDLLREKRAKLDLLSEELVRKETVEGEEFERLMK